MAVTTKFMKRGDISATAAHGTFLLRGNIVQGEWLARPAA
jgi:hypothetical protein